MEQNFRMNGAISVPGRSGGRVNASWPAGLLAVGGPQIELRIRWPRRLFGGMELSVSNPRELREVYLLDALVLSKSGLGFTDALGQDYYFWPIRNVPAARDILSALQDLGYSANDVPRKPEKRWSGIA